MWCTLIFHLAIVLCLCECVYRGWGNEKVNEEETLRGYIIVRISQAVRLSSSSVCVHWGKGGRMERFTMKQKEGKRYTMGLGGREVYYGTERRKEVYYISLIPRLLHLGTRLYYVAMKHKQGKKCTICMEEVWYGRGVLWKKCRMEEVYYGRSVVWKRCTMEEV